MKETEKPKTATRPTYIVQLPERVKISDLMTKAEIMERIETFRMGNMAVAEVFAFEGDEMRSVEEIYGGGPQNYPQRLIELAEKVQKTGEECVDYDDDCALLLACPIWLKCDGRDYLKGCFASRPPMQSKEAHDHLVNVARFVAGTFSDRISLVFGSRVARTEYEALERELKLGGELASILEGIGAGLMVVDHDLHVLWYNAVIAKRSKKGDPAGKICRNIFGQTCTNPACPALLTFETGRPQWGVPERRSDGSIFSRTSTMPLLDADGNVAQVLVLINDTSEERLAESELRNYKRLVDTSYDFMLISDGFGKILAVNRKMVETLGYPENEVTGNHANNILFERDTNRFHKLIVTAKQLGIAMDTVSLRTKDGVNIPTQVVIVFDDDRNMFEVVFRDISERLRMEDELRLRSEELQLQHIKVLSAIEERDRFFRNVSHELRTPLTSVIGFAELLMEDTEEPLSPRQKKQLSRVIGNSHKLLGMVNDLLDMSRIEAGRMELHVGAVKVEEFLLQIVANLAPLASGKDLDLDVTIAGTLPTVQTDEQKLGQIMVNLISNAIKFTNQGSVKISASATEKSFSISVKDTGQGISTEDLNDIFKEFYRGHKQAPNERGSGLGLAIAQRMAGLLGGRITVKSTPGEGSTFKVTLPLTIDSLAEITA